MNNLCAYAIDDYTHHPFIYVCTPSEIEYLEFDNTKVPRCYYHYVRKKANQPIRIHMLWSGDNVSIDWPVFYSAEARKCSPEEMTVYIYEVANFNWRDYKDTVKATQAFDNLLYDGTDEADELKITAKQTIIFNGTGKLEIKPYKEERYY